MIRLLAIATALLIAGCAQAQSGASFSSDLSSAVSPSDMAAAKIGTLPAGAVAPAITASKAVATADENAGGAAARGSILAVARATAKQFDDVNSPVRTVWVIAYGPGGTTPMMGPSGGEAPIAFQLMIVDDQTGEFVRGYIRPAGP
jgi:hypothetical protein